MRVLEVGNPDMECMVASGMADIMDDIYGELNEVCRKNSVK